MKVVAKELLGDAGQGWVKRRRIYHHEREVRAVILVLSYARYKCEGMNGIVMERGARRYFGRSGFWAVIEIYDVFLFRRAFRMNRRAFRKLMDVIRPCVTKEGRIGIQSSGGFIDVETRLAVFLRMMSGGSYIEIMTVFNMPKTTLFDCFHEVLGAMLEVLPLERLPLGLGEENRKRLEELSLNFTYSRRVPSPLNGCVGALDGIAIKIMKTNLSYNPTHFYSMKGFYALPVQAVVDASYWFLFYSAVCVGSTNDYLDFVFSSPGRSLAKNKFLPRYWIAGKRLTGGQSH